MKLTLNQVKEFKYNSLYNYDVGFSYNPKQKKAWYSEEFKNCSNGHYYLALNNTHAFFIEND